MPEFAEIAMPVPIPRTFTYRVPEPLQPALQLGMRVLAPFGPRSVVGYCVGFPTESPVAQLKNVQKVIDAEPMVDRTMLDLTRWIADYYLCAWGEALNAVLPPAVRRNRSLRQILMAALAVPAADALAESARLMAKHQRRARALEYLAEATDPVTAREAVSRVGGTLSSLKTLEKAGLVRLYLEKVEGDPYMDLPVEKDTPRDPTPDQAKALEVIHAAVEARTFQPILVHGVTGSGKTEIYLQAIDRVISRGDQAIVLVPEIALTPQMVSRFRARFESVAVLHSHLTEGQRGVMWHRIRTGESKVVVGARSAVFAPARRLGLIVVDEEHEPSFKQDKVPRYHARDVAVMRGKLQNAVVLLGSATPCLESYRNAQTGKYARVVLPVRVEGRPMPPVEVVDMTVEAAGKTELPILSRRLELLVKGAVSRQEQVILFLNRRGFSTLAICPRCTHVLRCRRCEVALTLHKQHGRLACHYCNTEVLPPQNCPECGAPRVRYMGTGTERVEEEMNRIFAPARIARMDSDSMHGKGAHQRVLTALWKGEIDILVGTQMIAKGLDFPNVTLVGVISGDTNLMLKDFRGGERTFQLVTQVAGRAGRGPKGGLVVVQSYHPRHYSIQHAARHDYDGFAAKELAMREELRYPPYGRLMRILCHGRDESKVRTRAEEIAAAAKAALPAGEGEVLGPAPAPIAKLKDRHRWHALIKGTGARTLHDLAKRLGKLLRGSKGLDVVLDVDPVSLL